MAIIVLAEKDVDKPKQYSECTGEDASLMQRRSEWLCIELENVNLMMSNGQIESSDCIWCGAFGGRSPAKLLPTSVKFGRTTRCCCRTMRHAVRSVAPVEHLRRSNRLHTHVDTSPTSKPRWPTNTSASCASHLFVSLAACQCVRARCFCVLFRSFFYFSFVCIVGEFAEAK